MHNIGKAKHHGIGFQPFPWFGDTLRSEADDIDWLHDNLGADPSNSMMVRIPNHHVRVIISPLREALPWWKLAVWRSSAFEGHRGSDAIHCRSLQV